MSGNLRSRSTLFLMEQIVVITVFAICAAICVYILVISFLMTSSAVDTKSALLVAESAAESYKAFSGDMDRVAEILNGSANAGSVLVYFDSSWQPSGPENASFVLLLTERDLESYALLSDISVSRIITGDELINLTVATRRGE